MLYLYNLFPRESWSPKVAVSGSRQVDRPSEFQSIYDDEGLEVKVF